MKLGFTDKSDEYKFKERLRIFKEEIEARGETHGGGRKVFWQCVHLINKATRSWADRVSATETIDSGSIPVWSNQRLKN